MKKYLIFDLDGTLIQSQHNIEKLISDFLTNKYPQLDPEYVRYVFSTTAGMPLKKQLKIFYTGPLIRISKRGNTKRPYLS